MCGFTEICRGVYLLREPFGGTTTGVILLRGEKNYLIDAGGSAALVDSVIVPALDALSLRPSDIDCLLCTHTHGDHIGGFARLRELGAPQIAVYEKSAPKLSDPLHYNIEIRKAFPKYSPPPSSGLTGVQPDRILRDGEVLDGRVRLVATPGHDDDAICILDAETSTLICGDSVQHNGTLVQGCGAYMYLNEYRVSMQKLLGLGAQNAVLGHPFLPYGDVIRGHAAVQSFLEDALRYTYRYRDFVCGQYEAGERDLAAIAERLVLFVGGVMPEYLFLPLYTVREHLRECI